MKSTEKKIADVLKDAFLSEDIEECDLIEEFKRVRCDHGNYKICLDKLTRVASRRGASGVVILTGPTGSGKTYLARSAYQEIKRKFTAATDIGPFVPIAGIRAVPPRATAFDWKDFFVRLLERLNDSLAERKLLVPIQQSLFAEMPTVSPAETMDLPALRRGVEKALRRRRTRVLIIDEAHHILMSKDPGMQKFIFEQLKSLTDETGIILVLVGTYDLVDIRDYSAQLMRRSEMIHLSRYNYNVKEDLVQFTKALNYFAERMPIPLDKSVLKLHKDGLFLKSVGCIGILRDLLLDCLRKAVEDNAEVITWELIEQCVKPNLAIKTILEEAIEGESRLIDIDDKEIREIFLTGMSQGNGDAAGEAAPAKRHAGRPVRRVGHRKPVRDAVGAG